MGKKVASAGRTGDGIRSDCYVQIELTDSKSINLKINSKVERLYGQSIRTLLLEILDFYEITSANVTLVDYGALPFTLAARTECAIKRLLTEVKKPFLISQTPQKIYSVEKDRFRRSRLYLPGNEPKFMVNAAIHQPDGIILDLEDSVAPSEKDAARILVRNALQELDFYGVEKMVRINQLPLGFEDLNEIVPYNVHTILIPKCESAKDVQNVDSKIEEIKKEHNINTSIYLMPIIESAKGVINAYKIAIASDNNIALTIGLEDFTADIGAERTLEGHESFMARSMVVAAARAAGIQPIDTVFSDVQNEEGLRKSTLESKTLGFEGRGCIHPKQINVIHESFAPKKDEIERAIKIVNALAEARKSGSGVVSLGSKMIDPPVVKRAQKILKLALQLKMLTPERVPEIQ